MAGTESYANAWLKWFDIVEAGAGTLWEGMESDAESTRTAIFKAIGKALSNYHLPDASLEIENQAICVSGQIA